MIARLTKFLSKTLFSLTSISLIATIGVVLEGITASPSWSAEAVRFNVDGPLTVSLSLDSLKIFAETGEISRWV